MEKNRKPISIFLGFISASLASTLFLHLATIYWENSSTSGFYGIDAFIFLPIEYILFLLIFIFCFVFVSRVIMKILRPKEIPLATNVKNNESRDFLIVSLLILIFLIALIGIASGLFGRLLFHK